MNSKIGRDAGTGKFIPVSEARARPANAVVETIKRPAPTKSNQQKPKTSR